MALALLERGPHRGPRTAVRLPPLPVCDAQGVEAAVGAEEGARSEGRQVRVVVAALLRERRVVRRVHELPRLAEQLVDTQGSPRNLQSEQKDRVEKS